MCAFSPEVCSFTWPRYGDFMLRSTAITGVTLLIVSCGTGGGVGSTRTSHEGSTENGESVAATGGLESAEAPVPSEPQFPPCDTAEVPLYAEGEQSGSVCPRDAQAQGYTLLDLSDDWTPYIFTEADVGGSQPYRPIFLALADERLREVPEGYDEEQYLELFGIFPTFRVILERIADDERHTCHEAIDDRWLELQDSTIRAWRPSATQQRRSVRQARVQRRRLEAIVERDDALTSIDELEDHPTHSSAYARYAEAQTQVGAVAAAQAHLRCDGLLRRPRRVREGVLGSQTASGLRDFQRRHMVVSAGFLDDETRKALAEDSRVSEFKGLLRVLRERVVAATGLIEDGSAGHTWQQVLGHDLDAPQIRFEAGREPAPNATPDLISPATEAAANALGLADAATAATVLRALRDTNLELVAVQLPALPDYHGAHMELRAEIDRGDVFYHYPYRDDGRPIGGRVRERPITTLYVQHEGQEIALLRWGTTIGGWKPETRPNGSVGLRYKDSPTGSRIWRDVIASPTWLPPPSTPDEELVRRTNDGYEPRRSIFGPGYRSAYGLVMMMHHLVQPPRREGGEPRLIDEGIRVHGSVSYRSIVRGTSHGCHRLYNHLAVRLSSFVLQHRNHTRNGRVPARYIREVIVRGDAPEFVVPNPLVPNSIVDTAGNIEARVDVEINTRGYLFQLTPPVTVDVLEGNIRGSRRTPIDVFRLLPEELVEAVQAEAAEDG